MDKKSKPISSSEYYSSNAYYVAYTNDNSYKIQHKIIMNLRNSWRKMDNEETAGTVLEYGFLGLSGHC